MNVAINQLQMLLKKCQGEILCLPKGNELQSLNNLASTLLHFVNAIHELLKLELNGRRIGEGFADIVLLCVTQIVTCVHWLEVTLTKERQLGAFKVISAAREHFQERVIFCFGRLQNILSLMANSQRDMSKLVFQQQTFSELMNAALASLADITTYHGDVVGASKPRFTPPSDYNKQAVRKIIEAVLSHTLALANVALKEDKKALGALCAKMLRECISFQDEIAYDQVKLSAMALESALLQLENVIKDVLMRLIFTCFLDYKKFSTQKLRGIFQAFAPDDPTLDGFVADFDVNTDRTTQIGIFAISYAPSLSVKNALRSCLASLESLETCLVPSLQIDLPIRGYLGMLECHFNDEIQVFRNTVQSIIDSRSFVGCYIEILDRLIADSDKLFRKPQCEDVSEMGNFVVEHFKSSEMDGKVLERLNEFVLILRECQAILDCAEDVEPQRILKRFKILCSTTRKLYAAISQCENDASSQMSSESDELRRSDYTIDDDIDVDLLMQTASLTQSTCNFLYSTMRSTTCRSKTDHRHESKLLLPEEGKARRIFPVLIENHGPDHRERHSYKSFTKSSLHTIIKSESEHIQAIVDNLCFALPSTRR